MMSRHHHMLCVYRGFDLSACILKKGRVHHRCRLCDMHDILSRLQSTRQSTIKYNLETLETCTVYGVKIKEPKV